MRRPDNRQRVIEAVLDMAAEAGVDDVVLIAALALHRRMHEHELRHALDPDHVVAVSTIVSESKSVRKSSLVGTFWGLGHTTSLLICGVLVLVLRLSIPEDFVAWMETVVAVMLAIRLHRVARQGVVPKPSPAALERVAERSEAG